MVLVYKDRVKESTVTTLTGTLTLAGALTGYQSFAAIGNTNSCAYCIEAVDSNSLPTGDWEVGVGVYTSSGTTLSRALILASSNSGSAVSLASGTKHVFCVSPAMLYANMPIPGLCMGRLTGTTGDSDPGTDPGTITSIFFTPHIGNYVTIFNGTTWLPYAFAEITIALGTLTSGKNYDVFLYDVSGAVTAKIGPAWTSDTARGTGAGTTELTTQDSIYVNNVAISGGPAAKAGLYVGSFRTTSTTQTRDSEGFRLVWNTFNQVPRKLRIFDTTDSWTYATAAYRALNGLTTNRVEVLVGLAKSKVNLRHDGLALASGGTGSNPAVGIGFDSTTASVGDLQTWSAGSATLTTYCFSRLHGHKPSIGYHYYQALEYCDVTAAGAVTFFGDGGRTYGQAGMEGEIFA